VLPSLEMPSLLNEQDADVAASLQRIRVGGWVGGWVAVTFVVVVNSGGGGGSLVM
jgi:hypothetical protein